MPDVAACRRYRPVPDNADNAHYVILREREEAIPTSTLSRPQPPPSHNCRVAFAEHASRSRLQTMSSGSHMFLALREIRHEPVRFGLIISVITLVAYLTFFWPR